MYAQFIERQDEPIEDKKKEISIKQIPFDTEKLSEIIKQGFKK